MLAQERFERILEILRENETFTKTIERKTVQVNPMESEILENNIGYIRLMGFDENCHEEFEKKVDELISKGAKSLIIDLRDNGVGSGSFDYEENSKQTGKCSQLSVRSYY